MDWGCKKARIQESSTSDQRVFKEKKSKALSKHMPEFEKHNLASSQFKEKQSNSKFTKFKVMKFQDII